MAKWLVKSEPSTWSWADQKRVGTTHWDGVRNFQAAQNLRKMQKGDLAFFYHSGEERQIVGIVEIVKEAYPDPSDPTGKFVMVDVAYKQDLPHPITLQTIKQQPQLDNLALVRQSRLSVCSIADKEWDFILTL